MSGYVLHPEAYTDLDDIWEYIAVDSPQVAETTEVCRTAAESMTV